jgi:hypothetical protein
MRAFGCALYLALTVGCKSPPHTLTPPPGCEDADLITCLQPFALETLSPSALARLRVEALGCFSKDKAEERRQAACLPLVMGSDAQGRGKVSLNYYCEDLCPDQGGVVPQFESLRTVEACCAAAGDPLMSGAFGDFRACMPPRGSTPSKACQQKAR